VAIVDDSENNAFVFKGLGGLGHFQMIGTFTNWRRQGVLLPKGGIQTWCLWIFD